MQLHHLASALLLSLGLNAFGQAAPSVPDLEPGIVVEKIEKNSAAEKAGLREGDLLLSWTRGDHKGVFQSPYNLTAVNIEERPRGSITIEGVRGVEKRVWMLEPDCACTAKPSARPNFSARALLIYRRAEQLLRAGKVNQARRRWQEIAARNHEQPWLYPWLLTYQTKSLADAKRWNGIDQLLTEAEGSRMGQQARPAIAASMHRLWAWTFTVRGSSAQAINHYRRALEIDLQAGSKTLAVAQDLTGLAAETGLHPTEAKSYLHQAMAIQEEFAPVSFELAHSLLLTGYLAYQAGELDQAEQVFRRALGIQEKLASINSDIALSLIYLGSISLHRDLPKAESYYRQALSFEWQLDPQSRNTALATKGLASVAWLRGELPKAEYYQRQALAMLQKSAPSSLDVAESLDDLSGILQDAGDLVKAEACERKALRIYRRLAPNSLDLASTLSSLGDIFRRQGHLHKSEAYYKRALAIEEKQAPTGFYTAQTVQGLADLSIKIGDLSRAQNEYLKAVDLWAKIAPRCTCYSESLAGLAQVMRRKKRWDEAARFYDQAMEALESQTARLGGGTEVRSGFRAKHQDFYRDYVDLLAQQHQPERAFGVLERSRARSLAEMLNTAHIDVRKGIDPALLEQQRSLQQRLTDKSNQRIHLLTQKHTQEQIQTLDKEIAELLSQYQDVEGQIRSSSPAYAALTQPQPLSAREVQQQLLDEKTLVLEYSLGEERSYLFALTPTTLNTYELPSRKRIELAARQVYTLLTPQNQAVRGKTKLQRRAHVSSAQLAYARATKELSRMILGPAVAELQGKRLLIVSDGALAYVPFAILPTSDGVPLIAAHEIVNLPSASALALLRRQEQGRTQPPKAVAVLADPVFSKDDPRVLRVSQASRAPTQESCLPPCLRASVVEFDSFEADLPAHLLQRSIGDVGQLHLGRLPYTRLEAQAIAAAVPDGQGLQALDFRASRETATSPDLAQYRIVHFATHGLLDSRHPELSGLVLSLVDEHGQPQNGFLELQDVYNLNLAADLVVLSACETGLGKQVDGEGLVGLTRGFMYAGASRVMASLWRVDDEATAQLMQKFYQGVLQDGQTPAQALRAAQLWMQAQSRWKQPYYWAGFVLQGEWK